MQTTTYRGHVTFRSGTCRPYELTAESRHAAIRAAILAHPGAVKASARPADTQLGAPSTHAERILGDLAVRMSGFPLVGAALHAVA
jgi:hypothetical protein